MNQQKMGEFLKYLRKEKGMTQEDIADLFYVSSRTVSRWETGKNMPDIETLIELADFYKVDIREIIEGKRKDINMDNEIKDTIVKVAEYTSEKNRKRKNTLVNMLCASIIMMICCIALFGKDTRGLLYGIIPEHICHTISTIVTVLVAVISVLNSADIFNIFDKLAARRKSSKEKTR